MYQQIKQQLLAANKQVGTTTENFGQCVGLVMYYWQRCGLPFFYGNAVDLPTNAPQAFYDVIQYQPGIVPQPGDAIIWGPYKPLGIGQYGHVDLFDSGNSQSFVGLDQNWKLGSPPTLVNHTYAGVIAIIRLKEANMNRPYNDGDAQNISDLTGEPIATAKSKQDWNDAFYAIVKPYIIQLQAQVSNLQTQVTQLQAVTPNPDAVSLQQLIKKIATTDQ